jgi:hypothetical protein
MLSSVIPLVWRRMLSRPLEWFPRWSTMRRLIVVGPGLDRELEGVVRRAAVICREQVLAPVQVCPELPQRVEVVGELDRQVFSFSFEVRRQSAGRHQ